MFTGTTLPVPPRQNVPWTPPKSDLPTNYVSATGRLFAQGMADPRGCEYRVVEVGTGNVWQGDGGVVETHGWVLPGDGEQKFAIAWNGLVYPVVSIGTNASLEADMLMVETNSFQRWYSAIPEGGICFAEFRVEPQGLFFVAAGKSGPRKPFLAGPGAEPQKFRRSNATEDDAAESLP